MFTNDSQWYRGRLLHRDPSSPNVWTTMDTDNGPDLSQTNDPFPFLKSNSMPADVARSSRKFSHVNKAFGFLTAGARALPAVPPLVEQCVGFGGYSDPLCPENSACHQFNDLSNGFAGSYSRVSVSGVCEQRPPVEQGGVTCTTNTTHSKLQFDASCPPAPPAPSPTPCGGDCDSFTRLEFELSHSSPSCPTGVNYCL